MSQIFYHPRAIKFLKKVPLKTRQRVIERIGKLDFEPTSENLNIKKLVGTKNSFRLRVGNIRVIYEVSVREETIYIQNIDFRGNIY